MKKILFSFYPKECKAFLIETNAPQNIIDELKFLMEQEVFNPLKINSFFVNKGYQTKIFHERYQHIDKIKSF